MPCNNSAKRHVLKPIVSALLCASGLAVPATALAQLEEIIVTAQKRSESMQDVPIALTAYDGDALQMRQITSIADVRYSAPNVSYTKDNFTGSNFKIRGVGQDLVAASSDAGVGIHVNELPLSVPRIFQTEYFDIEQLAILRGPQGTLYGRNSTGGAVNMITNRAQPGEWQANLELQYGNYDHKKVTGMVNVPMGESFAVRLAGLWLERDGYTENLFTGNDIDGRDQWALRGSAQWLIGDSTSLNIMASYMEEDSSRLRSQKQLCHNDPSGLLGCLPDKLAFETVNPLAQVTGLLPSLLGPLGITPGLTNEPSPNPNDMRQVFASTDPTYQFEDTLLQVRFEHDFERYSFTAMGSYHESPLLSQQNFNMNASTQEYFPSPLLPIISPVTYETYFANNTLPISDISDNSTGVVGGHVAGYSNALHAYDQSNDNIEEVAFEANLASDFDGPLNFMAGVFYMSTEVENDYWVVATGLDYFSLVFPSIPVGLGGAIGLDGYGWLSPNFRTETRSSTLDSRAIFGELYYDVTDTVKVTLGLRYTDDEKEIEDLSFLLNNDVNTGLPILQPFGADQNFDSQNPPRIDAQGWQETTGRIVVDWTPSDNTLIYGSLSRGYKGGGFNPPFDPNEFPNIDNTFEPEYVNALEVGTKTQWLDNRLQANFSAFYYDYEGLQVSKIINRTSFNENTDAGIYGAEAEFVFMPSDGWLFNANLAYLKTDVESFSTSDPRDPTQGRSDVTLIKSTNGSNCVVLHNGASAPDMPQINDCANLALTDGSPLPAPYTSQDGIDVDLDGNSLQNSPEFTVSLGGEYTFDLGEMGLTFRVDYYWQDETWGRIYNRDPIDKIDAFDIWNAQAILRSEDGGWFAKAFIKNIEDDDDVVGMYVADGSAGLFTNVFVVDPQVYGLAIGYNY